MKWIAKCLIDVCRRSIAIEQPQLFREWNELTIITAATTEFSFKEIDREAIRGLRVSSLFQDLFDNAGWAT